MTRCSTWHVRIDVIEDHDEMTARARLIGSPLAMMRPEAREHVEAVQELDELLATWRPLEDLGPVLATVLSEQHGIQHAQRDSTTFRAPVSEGAPKTS